MKKTLLSLLLILALLAGCAPSGGSSAPEEGEGTQSSSSEIGRASCRDRV